MGGQRNQRLPWCSGLSHQLLKCPRATSISLGCDSGGGSWLQGHGGTSRTPPRSLSPCPCPWDKTPPGPAAPCAGRSAAGAAGEAAAAALEPPDRSLSRLHLNVSETLFVPLTYNRQQPINRGQGSFLPAGCSGGQRPVGCPRCPGWHPELGTARRDPRPHRAPHRSPSAPLVSAVSAGLFENCTGCVLCSEDNGCITCHHRLFLLIWRDGIRQYGMCVHTCPPGYFGVRGLEVNRCTSTWCVRRGPCASERPGVPSLPRGSSPSLELRLGRAPGPFAHRGWRLGARPQLTAPLPGRVQVAQLRELLQQRLLHEVQGEVLPAQGSVLPAVPARHRGAARHP